MNAKTRAALAALPTTVVLFGLVGCGGSDAGDSADNTQATTAPAAGGEANAEAEGGDAVETPLTGEAKQKAEAAALKAYPGTVVKSEEDAENPGLYAVEIKKSDGTEIEVYLNPDTYKVVKTKDEAGDEDGS
ncbi:PepSY domain-containing protein [Streptomyces sp. 7N604]|uniref:PepSY domain-containing protein n=1 Tax=Streptomyces sp. 7N604 TaxID=3457415 RepID=UPI003FD2CF38